MAASHSECVAAATIRAADTSPSDHWPTGSRRRDVSDRKTKSGDARNSGSSGVDRLERAGAERSRLERSGTDRSGAEAKRN